MDLSRIVPLFVVSVFHAARGESPARMVRKPWTFRPHRCTTVIAGQTRWSGSTIRVPESVRGAALPRSPTRGAVSSQLHALHGVRLLPWLDLLSPEMIRGGGSAAASASLATPTGEGWESPSRRNGLSEAHADYRARGGLGFELGDGRLDYAGDHRRDVLLVEIVKGIALTVDYQFIARPRAQRRRGPVSVVSLRAPPGSDLRRLIPATCE